MPIFWTKEEKQFLLICWPFGQVVKNPTIPTFQTLNTPIFHSDRESNKKNVIYLQADAFHNLLWRQPLPIHVEKGEGKRGRGAIEEANNLKSRILSSSCGTGSGLKHSTYSSHGKKLKKMFLVSVCLQSKGKYFVFHFSRKWKCSTVVSGFIHPRLHLPFSLIILTHSFLFLDPSQDLFNTLKAINSFKLLQRLLQVWV